ncbi:hypothetical protein FB567DRAFT_1464 [Paraphoma chrysanthemicola]|uniref:Uncharacterized protein n=1 Tax=Paraphoma chrysanthemicola TaxID=798071 RepID=A0A8K0RGZ3_9PLEO|nr:hypothetical protein FB567DRAFT_1464 [Paraphoma chrysanthemicola]
MPCYTLLFGIILNYCARRTLSASRRLPRLVLIVLTRPSKFLYCVSQCSFPSLASSSSSLRLCTSASCFESVSAAGWAAALVCMLSRFFRNSVTSCRRASRSFAITSNRALASDGGGVDDGERPCCERDLASPSATAEDMLWCWAPLAWAVVGESGCSSSSTSSASGSVDCAAGC